MKISEEEKHMKKLSDQEYSQVFVRLLGNRDSRDFEADHFDLFGLLRERGYDDIDDWRTIGLALLHEAADRLSGSVGSQAEFEALVVDARDYLADRMRILRELRILAMGGGRAMTAMKRRRKRGARGSKRSRKR